MHVAFATMSWSNPMSRGSNYHPTRDLHLTQHGASVCNASLIRIAEVARTKPKKSRMIENSAGVLAVPGLQLKVSITWIDCIIIAI